jgi:hypothetical protein
LSLKAYGLNQTTQGIVQEPMEAVKQEKVIFENILF